MPAKKTPSRPPAAKAPAAAKPAKRRRIDWEAIERDYRTGRFTLRQLESIHGADFSKIGKRARTEGWTKDLSDVIRQATKAALIADVTTAKATESLGATTDVVLAAAEIAKGVILGQRARVGQATNVAMRMLAELDTTTTKADEIQALFEVLTDELDDSGKAAAQRQLGEFMRLHSRVASVQKLMDALGKAQTLERQAFALDDPNKPGEKPEPIDFTAIPEADRMAAHLRLVHGS